MTSKQKFHFRKTQEKERKAKKDSTRIKNGFRWASEQINSENKKKGPAKLSFLSSLLPRFFIKEQNGNKQNSEIDAGKNFLISYIFN